MKTARKIRNLEERNKWFNSLSKAEKRVEIAKDVIIAVKANLFRIGTGYFSTALRDTVTSRSYVGGEDLQSYLASSRSNNIICRGCAVAGLFYSRIILGNEIQLNYREEKFYSIIHTSRGTIHNSLDNIFTTLQLDLVETAFERNVYASELMTVKNEFLFERAISFGENYLKLRERLIAICENIIKNKGTFKP